MLWGAFSGTKPLLNAQIQPHFEAGSKMPGSQVFSCDILCTFFPMTGSVHVHAHTRAGHWSRLAVGFPAKERIEFALPFDPVVGS